MVDFDTAVELVPEPGQHNIQKAQDGHGVVRGDFIGVFTCLGLRFHQSDFLGRCFCGNGFLYALGMDQAIDQGPAMRKVRANHRCFVAAQVNPENPVYLANTAGVVLAGSDHLLEGHGWAEMNHGLSAVEQCRQKFPGNARPG